MDTTDSSKASMCVEDLLSNAQEDGLLAMCMCSGYTGGGGGGVKTITPQYG